MITSELRSVPMLVMLVRGLPLYTSTATSNMKQIVRVKTGRYARGSRLPPEAAYTVNVERRSGKVGLGSRVRAVATIVGKYATRLGESGKDRPWTWCVLPGFEAKEGMRSATGWAIAGGGEGFR